MSFFNQTEPVFRQKQESLDYQDLQGLLRLQVQLKKRTLFQRLYTRIDQVFVLWGVISTLIFLTAQFAPISWVIQAWFWSVLTLVGTAGMVFLTYFWVQVERLQWVLYSWAILMFFGVLLTDLGIFLGWGQVLMHLCHLWLGLSAIGYFVTGWGLRSRAFLLAGIIHLIGIGILPWVMGWQFLATGLIMAANLLIFAETQWDMRLPIEDYDLLTSEQKEFNQQQYSLRKV